MKHKIKQDLKKIVENLDNENYISLKKDLLNIYENIVIQEYNQNNIINKTEPFSEIKKEISLKKYPLFIENNINKKELEGFSVNIESQKTEKKDSVISDNLYKQNILNTNKKYPDIVLGLNDRISFFKNLFNNDSSILDRELETINTINFKFEMEKYLELMKSKYLWTEDKKEYFDRFFEIVLRRFSV